MESRILVAACSVAILLAACSGDPPPTAGPPTTSPVAASSAPSSSAFDPGPGGRPLQIPTVTAGEVARVVYRQGTAPAGSPGVPVPGTATVVRGACRATDPTTQLAYRIEDANDPGTALGAGGLTCSGYVIALDGPTAPADPRPLRIVLPDPPAGVLEAYAILRPAG